MRGFGSRMLSFVTTFIAIVFIVVIPSLIMILSRTQPIQSKYEISIIESSQTYYTDEIIYETNWIQFSDKRTNLNERLSISNKMLITEVNTLK